tara:strand:+ start:580 stop:1071 length:492 start_codon:yes stop_codon:yes gene_type:complete
MIINIKNKDTLIVDLFEFKCSIGKNGFTSNKREGDNKTPKGTYSIGNLYYRKDRNLNLETSLKKIPIKKNMAWCDDVNSNKYNKRIKINKKVSYEKLYRRDRNYDLLIPINYNINPITKNKGSAIFIHLTKNYKKTQGCIALLKKDFLILLKIINSKTKIKIG